jgi:hypothetical protein
MLGLRDNEHLSRNHGSSVLVIDKVDHHYIAVISLKLA